MLVSFIGTPSICVAMMDFLQGKRVKILKQGRLLEVYTCVVLNQLSIVKYESFTIVSSVHN